MAEGVKQLREIVASFEAAYEASDGRTGEAEFAPVLAAVVDPLLTVCERSAEALAIDAPTRCRAQSVTDSHSHGSHVVCSYWCCLQRLPWQCSTVCALLTKFVVPVLAGLQRVCSDVGATLFHSSRNSSGYETSAKSPQNAAHLHPSAEMDVAPRVLD